MIRKCVFSSWVLGCTMLLIVLLTGCGSRSTGATARSASPIAPSGCPGQSSASSTVHITGTVRSKTGSSFIMTTRNQGTVQVAYSSITLVTRESRETAAALQQGAMVKVAVSHNADQTYTAAIVVVMGGLPAGGTGSQGGLNGGSGTPPAGGPGAPGGNPIGTPGDMQGSGGLSSSSNCNVAPADPTNGHTTISGTLQSVSATQLEVSNVSNPGQPATTIMLTSATQFVKMDTVTSESIQAGMQVTVIASQSGNGQLTALALTILP